MKTIMLVFLLVWSSGCLSQTPEIDHVYALFSKAYATYDADIVRSLYTEDAFYLSPKEEIKQGIDQFIGGFEGMFERAKEKGEILKIEFDIVHRKVSENTASDIGYYFLTRINKDGEQNFSTGKFITLLEKTEEGWKFTADGYSDAPGDAFKR